MAEMSVSRKSGKRYGAKSELSEKCSQFGTVTDIGVKQGASFSVQPEGCLLAESGTVVRLPSRRRRSKSQERRKYLTEREVEQLCDAARKRGRYGYRDATMILVAYRHGLRVKELVEMRWVQVDLDAGRLQVRRCKGSEDSVQPMTGNEIRALRRIRREQGNDMPYVFVSERGAPFTTNGFFKMLSRAAESINLDDVHPHLLRHGCGFKLVNQGIDTRSIQGYLGHKNIRHTQGYTKLDARRFDGFWRD
jgi:type 1 fimbriae regulatory protein FimB/type 1 fimbriae regulatory protein FimE